jgi:hypothetical protein
MRQLTRADKWIIALILVVALGGIGLNMAVLTGDGERSAEVYQDGRLIQVIKLRAGYREELRLGGLVHFNLIVAENGRVRVADADCPDQVCVRTGWVSLAPQQIVCLPYRVVIKIVAAKQADIDDITH